MSQKVPLCDPRGAILRNETERGGSTESSRFFLADVQSDLVEGKYSGFHLGRRRPKFSKQDFQALAVVK